jgi:hypothetical protein
MGSGTRGREVFNFMIDGVDEMSEMRPTVHPAPSNDNLITGLDIDLPPLALKTHGRLVKRPRHWGGC